MEVSKARVTIDGGVVFEDGVEALAAVEDVEDVVEDDDVEVYDFEHVEVDAVLRDVAVLGWHRTNTAHDFGAVEVLH